MSKLQFYDSMAPRQTKMFVKTCTHNGQQCHILYLPILLDTASPRPHEIHMQEQSILFTYHSEEAAFVSFKAPRTSIYDLVCHNS